MWSEQDGWEGKRSRGLGDDGGGWKSSKRVEVARALVLDRKRSSFFLHRQLKRNLFSVLAPFCPVYLPFSPLCCFLSYCQIG